MATATGRGAMHFAEQHQCCWIINGETRCRLWCGHDSDHSPHQVGDYLQAPLLHPLEVAGLLLWGAERCPLCGASVRWHPWANVVIGWECDGPICVWLPKGPSAWIGGPEFRQEYEWRFHPCGCVGREERQ